MPASTMAAIADAVLGVVRGLDLGIEYTAERSYGDWEDELSDREAALVEVTTPREPTLDLDTRGSMAYTLDVVVTLRKRIVAEDRDGQTGRISVETLDPYTAAVETIAEAMVPDVFANVDASWLQVASVMLYDPQLLRQTGLFMGQVIVRFEARKSI
jgi:hypothetical protein